MGVYVKDKVYNEHMGVLYVVATPIGNLEDITIRAIRILLTVPVIACEDTRRTGLLVKILTERYSGYITPPPPLKLRGGAGGGDIRYISVRDWNEASIVPSILNLLSDSDVAMVSDAGTPLISDPGYKVVRAAREAGYAIVPIPGASAIPTSLCASGLPTNKFLFWGFLNKKIDLQPELTHIIYESPKRISKTLKLIREKYPQAEIVIAREMTKIHEYIGPDDGKSSKGEITLLVYIPKQITTSHFHGDGDLHN
jgi:16S rRNA (cytidine1402-2'-O)-methyltransferase